MIVALMEDFMGGDDDPVGTVLVLWKKSAGKPQSSQTESQHFGSAVRN